MKLTKWFPASIKPVHVGVYEIKPRLSSMPQLFKHWDGKKWGFTGLNIADAKFYGDRGVYLATQNVQWRGIKK